MIQGDHNDGAKERRLLVAILFRAILDLLSRNENERLLAKLFLEQATAEHWSFSWICGHLELCPRKVLRVLRECGYFEEGAKHRRDLRRRFKSFLRYR